MGKVTKLLKFIQRDNSYKVEYGVIIQYGIFVYKTYPAEDRDDLFPHFGDFKANRI